MAEFSELIKNFDKIRDYMRDFYVYGFKCRDDFKQKSSRTYDNEKRRIESYLGAYIKWDTSNKNKCVFVSLDSSEITQNPLYSAWKSKSFTNNDILLHFYILKLLSNEESLKIDELTDKICAETGLCIDPQTVRIKANEYVKEGILTASKHGKALYYNLSNYNLSKFKDVYKELIDAVKYFQEAAPLGVIGSYILDNYNENNDIFKFKHHFIVHTLEDKILLEILKAMHEKRKIQFINQSTKTSRINNLYGTPLKIFVSSQTGRRYVTVYNELRRRFINHRLDYIKSVKIIDECEDYDHIEANLEKNLDKCWGVSFGGYTRFEEVYLKLYIDEDNEPYILKRLIREGQNGEIIRLDKNVYLYSKKVFDANEMLPWIKTYIGRIISFESTNKYVHDKFYYDMQRMYEMYCGGDEN